mgnify:CR=1 FL=1
METEKKIIRELSDEEEEWIVEALGEGYTKKQLAKMYGVSVPTLNKFLRGETIRQKKK